MPNTIQYSPMPLRSPSGGEFAAALKLFFRIFNAGIKRRFEDREAFHMASVSDTVFGSLLNENTVTELVNNALALEETPQAKTSITALFEEILYFNWHFKGALDEPVEMDDQSMNFGEPKGSAATPAIIDAGLVITASIQTLMEKLPKWLQNLLHVVSEIAQLARLKFDE